MALGTSKISVTTGATLLFTPTNASSGDPVHVVIYVEDATPVYVGGSDVTTTVSMPIAQSTTLVLDLPTASEVIYARVTTGTSTVRVLATRQ